MDLNQQKENLTRNRKEVDRLLAEEDSSSDEDGLAGLPSDRATIESLIGASSSSQKMSNRISAPISLKSSNLLSKNLSGESGAGKLTGGLKGTNAGNPALKGPSMMNA